MGHGTDNKIVPLRKDTKKYGLRTVPEMIFVRFFVRFWKELRTALSNPFMAQKRDTMKVSRIRQKGFARLRPGHGLENMPPACFLGQPFRIPSWHKKRRTSYRCSSFFGTPEGIRTPDLLVRSQTLYPAELLAHSTAVQPTAYIEYHRIRQNVKHYFKKFLNYRSKP